MKINNKDTSIMIANSAQIEDGVKIGKGVKVWDLSHIRNSASIGEDTIIGRYVQVDLGVAIGKRCKVQNNVSIYSGVTIEDDVFVGPSVVFTNDLRPRAFNHEWKITPTVIKKGASLGANCTIVCGNTIGSYAMVAAGSVVTKNVEDYELVGGVPAKHMGWVDISGNVISKDALKPDLLDAN